MNEQAKALVKALNLQIELVDEYRIQLEEKDRVIAELLEIIERMAGNE